MTIKDIIRRRNITGVYHFTQAANLHSILLHGLMTRDYLERAGMDVHVSDGQRLDRCKDSLSLSISYPNGKMFYAKRRNIGGSWVVIELKPDVLADDCSFCSTNAASNAMSGQNRSRKGAGYLEKMFGNASGKFPVDEQAEVLHFGSIPVSKINRILFSDAVTLESYRAELRRFGVKAEVDTSFFNTRSYYLNSFSLCA